MKKFLKILLIIVGIVFFDFCSADMYWTVC